jgi:hypothetical protein
MSASTTEKWLKAAKLLSRDPTKKVSCPERGDGILFVYDVVNREDSSQVERYLVCGVCGSWNVIRITNPTFRPKPNS